MNNCKKMGKKCEYADRLGMCENITATCARSRTMRLIDADDLRQVLEVFSEKDSLGHTPVQLCDAMPTIDAVEVVRCGECIHHEEPRDAFLKAFVWCNFCNTHKLKNGYCNCGERKDEEAKDDSDWEEPANLEMGYDPYLGCYTDDC